MPEPFCTVLAAVAVLKRVHFVFFSVLSSVFTLSGVYPLPGGGPSPRSRGGLSSGSPLVVPVAAWCSAAWKCDHDLHFAGRQGMR